MRNLSLPLFPYRIDASGNTFPVVPLSLEFEAKKKEFLALIDSGATISIFRSEVAESLGVNIEKGRETYLGGVGGRIKGYVHKLKVEIASKKFLCPVVFSHEYTVSFNLLGREVFFKQFRIIFEEKKNYIRLE